MIILLNKDSRKKLSAHFSSEEFECPCCGYALIDTELVIVLEKIRTYLGIPVKINSGYRCPKHNAAVGGAPMSRHLIGCAADITWAGAILCTKEDSSFRKAIVDPLKWDTKIFGIGWGKTYIHVDTDVSRKHLTQWTYP